MAHLTRSAICRSMIRSNSKIELDDDELIYIRLNPRTHTPFGLGRLEVAFRDYQFIPGSASLCVTARLEHRGAVCAVVAGL